MVDITSSTTVFISMLAASFHVLNISLACYNGLHKPRICTPPYSNSTSLAGVIPRSGVRLRHNLLAIKCSLLYNRFSFSNSSSLAGFEAEVGPDGLEYFVFSFPELVYQACAWNSKPLGNFSSSGSSRYVVVAVVKRHH